MTQELDAKGLELAHEAYAKTTGGMLGGHPMANAITAYLRAALTTTDIGRLATWLEEQAQDAQMDDLHRTADKLSQAASALSASEARIAELERDMDTLEYLHSERDQGEKIVDEKLNAAEVRNAELTKALEFYADPKSYREQSRDDWSKENPGRDPTVAIRCGRFSVEAKAGFVIAPIYHDNQGDRARKTLEGGK